MAPPTRSALVPFLILFAALYAGFGVQSPYLPALLDDRGLRLEAIGMVLAAGMAVRLAAGLAGGRLADRLDAAKLVFAGPRPQRPCSISRRRRFGHYSQS